MLFSRKSTIGNHNASPSHVRYAVLAVLCSLAFLTYLDRICIMQVQGDIVRDLRFEELTAADEQRLDDAAADNHRSILTKKDEESLLADRKENDSTARRDLAKRRLHENRARERMSWVFSAFVWGYALFEVPGGWLGDVWGARGVIFRIVLWWSLFTALTGSVDYMAAWFASSPEPWLLVGLMVLVRFLFGLGEAGAYPNVGRALGRWFPYDERGATQGTIWLCSRLGGAAAPTIIAWLTLNAGGWRQAFWVLGAIGAVWAILFFLWFRNRPEDMPSVNAAECELIRSRGAGPGSIYDETHRPLAWRRLLLSTNLWALYIAAAAASFSWYFYITFLPEYLNNKFKMSYAESASYTGLPLLVGGVTCLLGGRLSDWLIRRTGSRRWGRSLLGLIGFAGAGLGAFLIPHMQSAGQVILIICLACAVQDLAVPCIWAASVDIGQRYAGTVSGSMNSMGAVGGALSPLIVAQVTNAYGWDHVFLIFTAAYALGALLWLRIDATETIVKTEAADQRG